MSDTHTNSTYWQGVRDSLPFLLVISPFGILFGVVATEAGLNLLETMSFSIVVIAGAAQFTALQLMSEHAPTFVVLASALAVNLRMAMYSASLTPHLGAAPLWQRALIAYFTVDQSYACSITAYENNPGWSTRQKVAYFFGTVTSVCPAWYVMTYVGAMIGTAIPPELALDFAVPITFIAIVAPMLRTPAHRAAAATSVVLALVFSFIPYNLGLMVAGVGGMMAGARVELWQNRKEQEVA
ncbi:AzlC family ABC transporter permease [Thalassovita taeanensis]|uniref:Predicted branched-chain amino acid permease (Azaleucine resistance) n=1 Tax=Thalassovita taeanensis TaxID=657014 RepID=A0A1H9ARF9_9RHOB|nr:AzlC family ABC transporter permease [Thalassovita taeanensis]SEP79402.1 Predicted branched-chain amino acid permease (azaleucine resistance) [Thalassovita taeanensis]